MCAVEGFLKKGLVVFGIVEKDGVASASACVCVGVEGVWFAPK